MCVEGEYGGYPFPSACLAVCLDIPVVDGDCGDNVTGGGNDTHATAINKNRYADGIHTYYGLGELIHTFHTPSSRSIGALTSYPNPVSSTMTIDMDMEVATTAKLVVMTVTGQLVSSETIDLSKGLNTRTMNVEGLTGGVYTIQIYANSKVLISKFVKIK